MNSSPEKKELELKRQETKGPDETHRRESEWRFWAK